MKLANGKNVLVSGASIAGLATAYWLSSLGYRVTVVELAGSPRLLVADEPTGQLDRETGLAVMALVRGIVEAEGVTALVSTHDPVMIALADRAVQVVDGRLVGG